MNRYGLNWLKWFRLCFVILALISVVYVTVRYPLTYWESIELYAARYELEPKLICAVIHAESKFNAEAVSPKGARGLMQLTKPTADWAAERMKLEEYDFDMVFDPVLNIEIGCWYLNRALRNHNGNRELALAAYNAGAGNVAKWLQNEAYSPDGQKLSHIPFEETRNYIKRVEFNYKVYSVLIRIYKKLGMI